MGFRLEKVINLENLIQVNHLAKLKKKQLLWQLNVKRKRKKFKGKLRRSRWNLLLNNLVKHLQNKVFPLKTNFNNPKRNEEHGYDVI